MSLTVYWNPVNKTILDGANSDVVTVLIKVFGELPITLSMDDMDKVQAMAATWVRGTPNPYEGLSNAIVEFGVIEITSGY